ncbi:hypothetical protein MHH81_15350 [Psychrobacillus sp. FSL H8-0484]|uniref:hypothetical protein n=1 Tax=Psychrobacillus sp. FSL H8-0484 TaxID=2921390 RepID=UPI0030F87CBE
MWSKSWWLNKWWFLCGSMIEIGNIFLLLLISYLSIIINIFIIFGLDEIEFLEILRRLDILNVILTTGISMLAGILIFELSKDKVRKDIIYLILSNCLVALIISIILTIQIEKKYVFFDLNLVYLVTSIFFIITLIIVFRANYNLRNVKEYIHIQNEAHTSREASNVKIDNTEYKM